MNQITLTLTIILGCALAFGCDDESPSNPPSSQDAALLTDSESQDSVDAESEDEAEAGTAMDAEVEVDQSPEPDAVVDAALEPDADPIIRPTVECEADDDCTGDFERCLSSLCTIDLRPEYFVVETVMVTEPANTAGLLQGVLQGIINTRQLNLIVEPGGPQDEDTYRWYVGNGGFRDGAFDYLGFYPIQNFDGFWRSEADVLNWRMDGDTPFVLNVPAGQVQAEDGSAISCLTSFNTTVALRIEPRLNDVGVPEVGITLTGFLRRSDAETVNFNLNGAEQPLVGILDDADITVDSDNDGVPDSYPFHFSGTAAAVTFIGDPPLPDGSNRDPQPDFVNHPLCP